MLDTRDSNSTVTRAAADFSLYLSLVCLQCLLSGLEQVLKAKGVEVTGEGKPVFRHPPPSGQWRLPYATLANSVITSGNAIWPVSHFASYFEEGNL